MELNTDRDRQIQKPGELLLLPPEILLKICSYLSPSDARTLRLCCKKLADTGAHYGFSNITIHVLKSDFEMLRAFSRHPIISKNIKKLTYRTATLVKSELPLFYSIDQYARFLINAGIQPVTGSLPYRLPDSTSNPVWSNFIYTRDVQENYEQYKRKALEQFLIVTNEEDSALLKEVLPKLQALNEIVLDNHPGEHRPPFNSYFAPLCRPRHQGPTQAMIYGLCDSGLQINKLSADWILPSILSTPFLQQIIPVCKYLKSIDLRISQPTAPYDPLFGSSRSKNELNTVAKFLKALPNLESLSVRYYDQIMGRWPLYQAIDPEVKWNNLRCIYFHEIRTNRHELIAFFQRHRLTLESVTIVKCDLWNTSIKIFLCQMKQILKLKEISICSSFDGQFEDSEDNRGFISDVGHPLKQHWFFGEPSNPRSLGYQVAGWFLRDDPSPLKPGVQNFRRGVD
ncbi:hypothetical protein ABKA04_009311 [Annulohypoxylon sp. FPYF3050]